MTILTNTKALIDASNRLKSAKTITVDTEFMRESTYWPKLCLIQAATETEVFVIDPLAPDLDLTPFLEVMRDESVLKVFHASRQDIEIFCQLGAIPKPVFDTQIAAMALGFGDQVAYDQLVRQLLKLEVDKGSRFTDWSHRPLSAQQIHYAEGDVTHLMSLYPLLYEKLVTKGRLSWVMPEFDALQDESLYKVDPEHAYKRLKPRKFSVKYLAVFKEIAAWRERTAQNRDQPRSRIIKDEAIDELATQCPQTPAEFDRLRSVPKGFGASKMGVELSDVIKRTLSQPDHYAPPVLKPQSLPQIPTSVVEMLKVLLRICCDEQGVAPKLLASVSDLEKMALDDMADIPALSGWRFELFGRDALRLKNGELALRLKNGRVELTP